MARRSRLAREMVLDLTPVLSVIMHLIPMLLVVVRFRSLAMIELPEPSVPLLPAPDAAAWAEQSERVVSVTVATDGIVVGGAGEGSGNLPCRGACSLTTYDWLGLERSLVDAKALHPAERRVVLAAAPTVPYEVLVKAMDTCRERRTGAERTVLFPEVIVATPPPTGAP